MRAANSFSRLRLWGLLKLSVDSSAVLPGKSSWAFRTLESVGRKLEQMRRLLPLVLLALVTVGCMNPESRVIGKWKGEIKLSDTANRLGGSMARGMSGFLDPQIDLRPDKSFTLHLGPMPIEGTWQFSPSGKEILLNAKSYMGLNPGEVKKKSEEGMSRMMGSAPFGLMPGLSFKPGQPLKLHISQDWKTLSLEAGGDSGPDGLADLTFTKV